MKRNTTILLAALAGLLVLPSLAMAGRHDAIRKEGTHRYIKGDMHLAPANWRFMRFRTVTIHAEGQAKDHVIYFDYGKGAKEQLAFGHYDGSELKISADLTTLVAPKSPTRQKRPRMKSFRKVRKTSARTAAIAKAIVDSNEIHISRVQPGKLFTRSWKIDGLVVTHTRLGEKFEGVFVTAEHGGDVQVMEQSAVIKAPRETPLPQL